MKNEIKKIETVSIKTKDGISHAIMVSLNIFDLINIDPFLKKVIKDFKSQRMMSPPDTSLMLITIIGELSDEDFKKHWKNLTKTDDVLDVFLSQMTKADVIWGAKDGSVLGKSSLIES